MCRAARTDAPRRDLQEISPGALTVFRLVRSVFLAGPFGRGCGLL